MHATPRNRARKIRILMGNWLAILIVGLSAIKREAIERTRDNLPALFDRDLLLTVLGLASDRTEKLMCQVPG